MPSIAILPWHIGLALAALCLVLYALARVQLARAREDLANAFFYSPSQKARHRLRRRQWRDRCWALLAGTVAALAATVALYLRRPT